MKHPRSSDLPKIVAAFERAGRPVAAVEVRWVTEDDGREAPVWRIVFGEEAKPERVSLG